MSKWRPVPLITSMTKKGEVKIFWSESMRTPLNQTVIEKDFLNWTDPNTNETAMVPNMQVNIIPGFYS